MLTHCYSCLQRWGPRPSPAVRQGLLYLPGSVLAGGGGKLSSIPCLGAAPHASNSHYCFTNSLCIATGENSWGVSGTSAWELLFSFIIYTIKFTEGFQKWYKGLGIFCNLYSNSPIAFILSSFLPFYILCPILFWII